MLPHRITNMRVPPQPLRRPLEPLDLLHRLGLTRRQRELLRLHVRLLRHDHALRGRLRELDGHFFGLSVGGGVGGVANPLAGEGDLGFVEFHAGVFFGLGDEGGCSRWDRRERV